MKTILHIIWGREAVSRYKLGIIDSSVRQSHNAYEFEHPREANAFLHGVRQERDALDWILVTNSLDVHKLGMPLRARLIEAARRGDAEAVKNLVQSGVKLDLVDENGMGALHHAAQNGNAEVVCVLIEAGASVNAPTSNAEFKTPLHLASESGTPGTARVVDVLIENSANVNARDNLGNTPLHALVSGTDSQYKSAEQKARTLLGANAADPRSENNKGQNPSDLLASVVAGQTPLNEKILQLLNDKKQQLDEFELARLQIVKRLAPGIRNNDIGSSPW